ncbi:ATP-binding cassette domain-containing protein [Sagittula sp. M10.9X]|uniref:ATP-binding cassette domain-containing protein n=2 Tax=Sagittula salina TaxID=2820268 RepID=A0A940S153_9RHOB|nr:ATP-binding cassette domain-containing protein [Sagittula salina]MBP0482702.1 ATP-binding cassette domain-containing protein [Sagittula salina]
MEGGTLDADLALAPGRRVAVLGPSGAGKSTLLDVIAGFRPPLEGHVSWQGRDLTPLGPEARPVSILFQDANLFPHLDLARNLGLALRPDGRRPGPEEIQRIEGALRRVGLDGYARRRPGTLSGGQQSRAALARVLLMARPVLLLDEPFAALGPGLKRDMLGVVREVAAALGALTVLVTHDPEDARAFAQEVVLVADGLVHPPVATEAFFAVPPRAFREYMGL